MYLGRVYCPCTILQTSEKSRSGVQLIKHSHSIQNLYLDSIELCETQDDGNSKTSGTSLRAFCRIFENGIAYVGTDYLSHVLWDKYVKFEMDQGHPDHVTRLYVQILGSPLRDIDRYNSRYSLSNINSQLTKL